MFDYIMVGAGLAGSVMVGRIVTQENIVRAKQIINTRHILDLKKWQESGFHVKLLGKGE